MKVNTALEAREVFDSLRKNLKKVRYNPDLQKLLRNIDSMIIDLSKLEVTSRRAGSSHLLVEPLERLNESIARLEKLILVAMLMD